MVVNSPMQSNWPSIHCLLLKQYHMAENKFHYNNYSIPIAGSYGGREAGERQGGWF
jgi:hypothetical protein